MRATLIHPTRKVVTLSVSSMGEPMLSHKDAVKLLGEDKGLGTSARIAAYKFFKELTFKGSSVSGAAYLQRK